MSKVVNSPDVWAKKSTPDVWGELTLQKPEDLTRVQLSSMFQGDVAGVRIPQLLSAEECELVVARLRKVTKSKARQYDGNLNIGTVLDIPAHWEFTYTKEDENQWLRYFPRVAPTVRLRRSLFEDIGDPVDRLMRSLQDAWGKPVRRAIHPRFGRALYVGLIRAGAPLLHFDWAPYDLPGMDVVMQAGANVYLSNFKSGGDLKMYRRYGMTRGNPMSSGEKVIGNYNIPKSLVRGAPSHTIRCGVGDFVIAPNRFLHEVTKGDEDESVRLVLSFHVAWMGDGTLAVFS